MLTMLLLLCGTGWLIAQENTRWSRIIYRHLDLSQEANAPLHYPVSSAEHKTNLFSLLFALLQDNSVTAYEYVDGREVFSDDYKIELKEFLDRFDIYYETTGSVISVHPSDIPTNEIEGYYIKEAYSFDNAGSGFSVSTLAICPILQRTDASGFSTRYPLFWIAYDDIAPYAKKTPITGSSLNNSAGGTLDDFFRMRKYEGEIYKAQNPRNLTISQYTSTPEEMKAEQEKIEQELINFEQNLRKMENHPAAPQPQKMSRKEKRKSSSNQPINSSNSMRDRRY